MVIIVNEHLRLICSAEKTKEKIVIKGCDGEVQDHKYISDVKSSVL